MPCVMILYCPVHGEKFKGTKLPKGRGKMKCDQCQRPLIILDITCGRHEYEALRARWAEKGILPKE